MSIFTYDYYRYDQLRDAAQFVAAPLALVLILSFVRSLINSRHHHASYFRRALSYVKGKSRAAQCIYACTALAGLFLAFRTPPYWVYSRFYLYGLMNAYESFAHQYDAPHDNLFQFLCTVAFIPGMLYALWDTRFRRGVHGEPSLFPLLLAPISVVATIPLISPILATTGFFRKVYWDPDLETFRQISIGVGLYPLVGMPVLFIALSGYGPHIVSAVLGVFMDKPKIPVLLPSHGDDDAGGTFIPDPAHPEFVISDPGRGRLTAGYVSQVLSSTLAHYDDKGVAARALGVLLRRSRTQTEIALLEDARRQLEAVKGFATAAADAKIATHRVAKLTDIHIKTSEEKALQELEGTQDDRELRAKRKALELAKLDAEIAEAEARAKAARNPASKKRTDYEMP
ncbi:MAG: hypothetical protein K8I02_06425 [Candidatus Methylomirabilis sp.]|nr:hypothetical protein [Deltaproteobacteria bacterium]